MINSKCTKGLSGCVYCGDLFDICPKYVTGSHNGSPIIAKKDFPEICRDCEDKDYNFCARFKDLIYFKDDQDPFNCGIDPPTIKLSIIEFDKMRREAMRKACSKRHISYREK